MENIIKDTALMVFSLSARKEAQRKTLFGRGRTAVTHNFFDVLIKQTAEIALSSGLDVIWIDETRQRGANFGERYANAFEDVFSQGYEKVISIGNDCPELTLGMLRAAIMQIKDKTLVLGPAADGGIYLLGLHRGAFNVEEFMALPWMGKTLFSELTTKASGKGLACICLKTLSDTDTAKDALYFAWRNPGCFLSLYILQSLPNRPKAFTATSCTLIASFSTNSLSLRGPPLVS